MSIAMRRILLLASALLIPSTALATPWFDQSWAEQLVATEFPDYWAYLERVKANGNMDLYINDLRQGRNMALNKGARPELVEAWETRFYALESYRDLLRTWRNDPATHSDTTRMQMISAAEDFHLANLELFDAQLVFAEARVDHLGMQIADHELNFDHYALETVERAIGD
jgi:hypothetical protein